MSNIDPNALVAGVGAYLGSKELLGKLLGPTADYLGEGLKDWAKKRLENTNRILEKADKKLGDKINEHGAVPPRVLKEILNEGSYADDELVAEYFGGVLASSRSGVSRDDRGATFAKLVARLSSYQVRSHFIFYTLIKQIFDGEPKSITTGTGRRNLRLFISFEAYYRLMEFTDEEDMIAIIPHVFFGLAREELIGRDFASGDGDHIREQHHDFDNATGGGIVISPSSLGVELYMWAHGKGTIPINNFLARGLDFENDMHVEIISGVQRLIPKDSS